MSEPTTDDIDALVGPATPHFAFQIRARVREAIEGLRVTRSGRTASSRSSSSSAWLCLDEGGELGARVARPDRLGDDSVLRIKTRLAGEPPPDPPPASQRNVAP